MVSRYRRYKAGSSSILKGLMACRESWNKYVTKIKFGKAPWKDYRQFSIVFERLIGRCFFTTFENQVGVGPSAMQSGDIVYILYGCLCVILRPCGTGYWLVGTAYINGVMSGEFVSSSRDKGKHRVEESYFLTE